MWRRCDLHLHTTPNEQAPEEQFNPEDVVSTCLDRGLGVIAITDHDHADHVEAVVAAAHDRLIVIPGVEISTDHGHLLALAPGENGLTTIREFVERAGIHEGSQRAFDEVLRIARTAAGPTTGPFRDAIVLVGAHVDLQGSLLGDQPLGAAGQVELAAKLHALEVVEMDRVREWNQSGIKQSGLRMPLLRGSDGHTSGGVDRFTYLYLPAVDQKSLCHALSLPESSIRYEDIPLGPTHVIDAISFEGGMHDGLTFDFSERANALIGPPSSGKSLVVDALRFVFSMQSDIEEIRETSTKRLARSLGDGGVVRVTGVSGGEKFRLERTWGGAQTTTPPFLPIVFSQTELVRRGMDAVPSMALLDVHCPKAVEIKQRMQQLGELAAEQLHRLVEEADRAKEIGGRVNNPEDGIEATRGAIQALGASEEIARRAGEVSRVRSWRSGVSDAIKRWADEFEPDGGPELPEIPAIDKQDLDAERFLPGRVIETASTSMRNAIAKAAEIYSETILAALAAGEDDLGRVESDVSEQLDSEGFQEGSEVLTQLDALRRRFEILEQARSELIKLTTDVGAHLEEMLLTVRDAASLREELREARKEACTKVNHSMRTFFVRLDEDEGVDELNGLLEEAKRGTYQQAQRLGEVRDSLDRARLVEVAVRHRQGIAVDVDPRRESQDDIARNAAGRALEGILARLATTWPEDRLILESKETRELFGDLTEGMRALAIKEISFAQSAVPVVTDQPEDAVPPQNVYENLVPTFREQRADRQFILASHDANIVVAGDVERIHVLRPGEGHIVGTLFDEAARDSAIELLEGGREAFQVRAKRYRDE